MRTNLVAARRASSSEAETLGTDDFRERVRDLVVEMAATGQTGMGFPEEYGGGGDIGGSIAAFETLAFGDLSRAGQGAACSSASSAARSCSSARSEHHDAYLARPDHRASCWAASR